MAKFDLIGGLVADRRGALTMAHKAASVDSESKGGGVLFRETGPVEDWPEPPKREQPQPLPGGVYPK